MKLIGKETGLFYHSVAPAVALWYSVKGADRGLPRREPAEGAVHEDVSRVGQPG